MNLSDYKFPGVPKPFEHQVETTKFIVENDRCFVFNDIGTGKTWSAVWAIDILGGSGGHSCPPEHGVRNVLVIAPLSTLEIVWARTFFHLNSGWDVAVLKGTAGKKWELANRPAGLSGKKVSIINPDSLHLIKGTEGFDMILVDESAMFRNGKSKRVKALAEMCRSVKRVVMMTGSPCPEAPTDIWATARIICPDRVPRFFGQFRDMTMRKISMFKWVALPDAQEKISAMLQGKVIRYTRDECIDLPPSQHHTLELDATKDQTKLITAMRKYAVALSEEGATVVAANEAVVISKILQIASGAVKYSYGDEHGVIDVDCKPKFDALEEILEASTQPVIVFAPFKAAIAKIEAFFSGKIPYGVVTGDTPAAERMQCFDALQCGLIRVLIAHPASMSHGITLTNSNIIVWWSPVYSHETYEQANGRVVRPGQTRSTYFIHLTCSSLERKVLAKLETKSQLQGTLLEYLQRSEN